MAAAAIVAATWQKSTSGSKFMDRKDSLRSFIFFESALAVQSNVFICDFLIVIVIVNGNHEFILSSSSFLYLVSTATT